MCQVDPGPTVRASGSVNPRGENPPSPGKSRAAFTTLGSRERRENPPKPLMGWWGWKWWPPLSLHVPLGDIMWAWATRAAGVGLGEGAVPFFNSIFYLLGFCLRCHWCGSGVTPQLGCPVPNLWHTGTVRAVGGDGRRERDD